MHNLRLVYAVLLSLCLTSFTYAEFKFQAGAKAGMFFMLEDEEEEFYPGFTTGMCFIPKFNSWFGLSIEPRYSYIHMQIKKGKYFYLGVDNYMFDFLIGPRFFIPVTDEFRVTFGGRVGFSHDEARVNVTVLGQDFVDDMNEDIFSAVTGAGFEYSLPGNVIVSLDVEWNPVNMQDLDFNGDPEIAFTS